LELKDFKFARIAKVRNLVTKTTNTVQEMITVPSTYNECADFWRYQISVNVIPADTKNKMTWIRWSQYQYEPISEEQHNQWKLKGMAIILGRICHDPSKDKLYLIFIYLDNQKALVNFCEVKVSMHWDEERIRRRDLY
jgi:hypothetical protein